MYPKDQFFDRISCDKEGNILKLLPLQELFSTITDSDLKRSKKKFWKQGFVTQPDINYFSMKMLQNEKYDILPKIIKNRFEYIIIDEAQDVNDIQMEIINKLIENELKIILIGNPDQSIFEFNHANPELFQDKAENAKKNKLLYGLNTNFRSSQEICNFSYKFSNLPSKSRSYTGNSGIPPKIIYYKNAEEFRDIIHNFLKDCEKYNIKLNNENVAIIARSNKLLKKLQYLKKYLKI